MAASIQMAPAAVDLVAGDGGSDTLASEGADVLCAAVQGPSRLC